MIVNVSGQGLAMTIFLLLFTFPNMYMFLFSIFFQNVLSFSKCERFCDCGVDIFSCLEDEHDRKRFMQSHE